MTDPTGAPEVAGRVPRPGILVHVLWIVGLDIAAAWDIADGHPGAYPAMSMLLLTVLNLAVGIGAALAATDPTP